MKPCLFNSVQICWFDHIDFVQNNNVSEFDLVNHQMNHGTIVIFVINFETIAEKVAGVECRVKVACVNNSDTVIQSCNVLENWKVIFRINFLCSVVFVAIMAVVMIVAMIVVMVVIMIVKSERERFCDLRILLILDRKDMGHIIEGPLS